MNQIWAAAISALGVVASIFGGIYAVRKTTSQADKANLRTQTVESDKTGIEGLRELAIQNRLDREDWRQERAEMVKDRNQDRRRLDMLERRVAELETEREADRAQIETMKIERSWRVRYIHILIDFIKGLGHQPPPPENPVVLQEPR